MGNIATAFYTAFRDYVTDGVPASGAYSPLKSLLRALGATIEANVQTTSSRSVSTADSVQTTDAGATIVMGGSATYTEAIGAPGGFPANFAVRLLNVDSNHAKLINISGWPDGAFFLCPRQSIDIELQAGAWYCNRQRWRINQSTVPTFYIDPTSGSDSNDGLNSGAGAFATIQHAHSVIVSDLDCTGGAIVPIQLPDGIVITEQATIATLPVGSHAIQIQGDPTGTLASNFQWTVAASQTACFITDMGGGGVVFVGINFNCTGAANGIISAGQGAIADVSKCILGSNVGGITLMGGGADGGGKINCTGVNTIEGNCSILTDLLHSEANFGGAGFNVAAGSWNIGIFVQSGYCSFANVQSVNFSGPGTLAGSRYNLVINGCTFGNGTASWGSLSSGTTSTGGQAG